jgi:hypothetical protein
MADTKPPHGPVESDGINYRGIIWFVVVLAIVIVSSQILIWVVLRTMQHNQAASEAPVPSVAAQPEARQALEGRVYPGMVAVGEPGGPAPQLLVREPENLAAMRAREDETLTTWGWADQAAGTYRMPIARAKELLLERGLPVRGQIPAPQKGRQP